jgi:hypothetical protein
MDPLVCFEFIRSMENDHVERAHSVQDLAAWIARGGFVPDTQGRVLPDSHEEGPYEIEQGDFREIIAAVNVALLYGDLSGLEGLGYTVQR